MINNIEHISDCFKFLSDDDITFLNERKTQVSYLKGETIFKQGAFATHVLFVNSGLAMVYLQIDNNKQINIRIVHQGDYVAFSSIFTNSIYHYSAISLSDSTFCMIDREALKSIIMRNPEFAMNILTKNNENEARYISIIKNVSYKQMRGKIASALLYLSSNKFINDNIFQFLSRQNIADFASVTVESAVKFLKEFEKEGIIILDNKDVIVKDEEKLKNISSIG